MRQRAEGIKVFTLTGDEKTETKLVAQPMFRYSDQARFILDATLWGWTHNGRPVAVCKMEGYRGNTATGGKPRWLYNYSSFSTGLIEAEWNFGHRWSAKKPALKLATLPNGPTPSESKAGRMRQLKELSRRFSATMFVPVVDRKQEMRLLSRPIYRYSHPDSGLRDGAVFGLTNYGTNPDALFVIELHQKKTSTPTWKYGFVGMTQGALSVRLDDKEVWTKPWTETRGSLETWTWFYESSVLKGN